MKKHLNKILILAIIGVILVFSFLYGGDAPNLSGMGGDAPKNDTVKSDISYTKDISALSDSSEPNQPANKKDEEKQLSVKENPPPQTDTNPTDTKEKDNPHTDSASMTNYPPTESDDEMLWCTLSVRCDTILQNFSSLNSAKADIVPKDGVIFSEKTVSFYEGETVFNILMREMKRNKIHLEFENTPIYNSAYIEGIANIYEFDCGELSGWMYRVNGVFPNYGCSLYKLKEGDKVEWLYTCNLGADIGGNHNSNSRQ